MPRKGPHVDPLSPSPVPRSGPTPAEKCQAARKGALQNDIVRVIVDNISRAVGRMYGEQLNGMTGPERWAVLHLVSLDFTGRRFTAPAEPPPSPWMDLSAGAPALGTEVSCRVKIGGEVRDRLALFVAPRARADRGWATVLVDGRTRSGRVYKPIAQSAIAE